MDELLESHAQAPLFSPLSEAYALPLSEYWGEEIPLHRQTC